MASSIELFSQVPTFIAVSITSIAALVVIIFAINARATRNRNSTREEISRLSCLTEQMAQAQASLSQSMAESQAELSGRVQQSHSSLNDRLDLLHRRLGDSLAQQTEKTGQNLKELEKRLAIIDRAQQTITGLSQQMISLQDILSNKQSRGAFGEIQLQDLVSATLPPTAYEFQSTLGNKKRADCLLKLPNPPGAIVVDSKFPLESFQALREARDESSQSIANRAFSSDVTTHVKAIAEKYIIPGETADSALMFLPSEAVYAELHANFRNVVEDSFRRRVWIVSPTTLMATLNTVRAILKDAKMREQANVIQTEIIKMMDDVGRLDKRVGNLQGHFNSAINDIKDIRVSTDKILQKGARIDALHFQDDSPVSELSPDSQPPKAHLEDDT